MANADTSVRFSRSKDIRQQNSAPQSRSHVGHRAAFAYPHTPALGFAGDDDNSNTSDDSAAETEVDEDEDNTITRPLSRRYTLSKSYTTVEERSVVRKLDRKLVLFLAFLYLLSFLDRSNIGNARIAGLESALGINSSQFDLCLMAFYITYITFEWMILLYRLVPPHTYISLCVFCWGLVASLQSVVGSFGQLLVLRSLLGVTEAAFGPGVPFYMTFFYRREELAYRVGLQISAAPLATSFASSLAWVIVKISQKTGFIEPWRALFLFEGFPSIITAVFAWYWIPDSPGTAKWLTSRERKVATMRLRDESQQTSNDHNDDDDDKGIRSSVQQQRQGISITSRRSIVQRHLGLLGSTFLDPKSYLPALMFLSVNVSFASLPVFLPTIINSMSFSPLTSQILAAPPYLVAFAFVLATGYFSDRTPHSRGICLCAAASLSCLSYTIIALAGLLHRHDRIGDGVSIVVRYTAVYTAAMGLFASVVLIITWTLNNQQTVQGKGIGMVMLNVVGQCGPLIGVELFPESHSPLYVSGMAVCALFMGGVAVLSWGLRWWLKRVNAKMQDRVVYEMVEVGGRRGKDGTGSEEDENLMGHKDNNGNESGHRRFEFML